MANLALDNGRLIELVSNKIGDRINDEQFHIAVNKGAFNSIQSKI